MSTLTQSDLDAVAGMSSRKAAEVLKVAKSTVNKYREIARLNGGALPGTPVIDTPFGGDGPKVLYLDIETKPAVVVTFNLWKPILGPQNVLQHPEILCFTYNWEGQEVQFIGQDEYSYQEILGSLRDLLDEADIVVHYNGKTFDIPWIEGELNIAGFQPFSPVQQIDLYRRMKQRSNFINNRMEYMITRFLDDHKVSHSGMTLWLGCMENDPESWRIMRQYAMQDTRVLEPFYKRVRGWLLGHPNRASWGDALKCPRCESYSFQRRGMTPGHIKYQRYQCNDCGGWFTDGNRVGSGARARGI